MERMPHGYTNHTATDGTVVVKTYLGPDAEDRLRRESRALRRVRDRLPVPAVVAAEAGTLITRRVEGVPGQALIAEGRVEEVLAAAGRTLAVIHALTPDGGGAAPGRVLVHGDYGPNNLVLAPDAGRVTAVVDWEWTHTGDPVTDLAWCEWIIRTHHPEHIGALGAFHDAYGPVPDWPHRHAAMLARCRTFLAFVRRWAPEGGGVELWRKRIAATADWGR